MLACKLQCADTRATLADALLNQHQPSKALAVANAGLLHASSHTRLQGIKTQAEARIACTTSSIAPFAASRVDDVAAVLGDKVWSSVRFKTSVFSVCPCGHGDYYDLCEAIRNAPPAGCTVVLAAEPGIEHLLSTQASILPRGDGKARELQIIGARPDTRVRLAETADQETASLFFAEGKDVCVWLENLVLHNKSANRKHTAIQHCVRAAGGARMSLHACTLLARSACLALENAGTTGTLHSCVIRAGSGAAGLAADGATLICDSCEFNGTRDFAVESRSNATVRVQNTKFDDTSRQAAAIWKDGRALELIDCVFTRCGRFPNIPAISIISGRAVLQRCKIIDCPDDGVVIEARDPQAAWPTIAMTACLIHRCARRGFAALHCNGSQLKDNVIIGNAGGGMSVVTPRHGVTELLRNTVLHNGSAATTISENIVIEAPIKLGKVPKLKGITFDCNQSDKVPTFLNDVLMFIDPRSGHLLTIQDVFGGAPLAQARQLCADTEAAHRAQTMCDVPDQESLSVVHFNKVALVIMHEYVLRVETEAAKKQPVEARRYTHASPNRVGATPSNAAISSLQPCAIMELSSHLGERANGRVLIGDLLTHPRKLNSIQTVMGDGSQHAVWLQIYNTNQALRAFPKGQRIAIKEPFLKRRADTSLGIRVDNPADIVLCCRQQCLRDCVVKCPCCAVMFCSDACRQIHHGHADVRAILCGLQTRPDLNGHSVLLGKYNAETGKYCATFLDPAQANAGKTAEKVQNLCQPKNVRLADGTAVIITGVEVKPELNGTRGTVSRVHHSDPLRCAVEVQAVPGDKQKTLALKLGCVLAAASVEGTLALPSTVTLDTPANCTPTTPLKVVCWNVLAHMHTHHNSRSHGGVSCETAAQRQCRHVLIAQELNRLDPDVAFLQEVDPTFMPVNWQPTNGTALPCGVELLPGHTLHRPLHPGERDTVAILVRDSIVLVDVEHPPVFVECNGKTGGVVHLRHRVAAHGDGGTKQGSTPTIAVASVHLRSGEPEEKQRLLRKLVDCFAPGCARIIGGDFNTSTQQLEKEGIHAELSDAGVTRTPTPADCRTIHTTRQHAAARAIDHLYVSKELEVTKDGVQVCARPPPCFILPIPQQRLNARVGRAAVCLGHFEWKCHAVFKGRHTCVALSRESTDQQCALADVSI